MKRKCLIIDEMHESIIPQLEAIGFKVAYRPTISRQEILECISDFELLLVRSKTEIDAEIISKASQLKLIGRAGAGLDKIDIAAAEEAGIEIVNAPEGNRDALAEHAIGLMLSMLNKIKQADEQVRNWIWDREGNRGVELSDKTVGIIGYGYMGQAFVQRLRAFDCRILVYDKYKKGFGTKKVEEVGMEKIFDKTDILSIHVPLTTETAGWMTEDFYQKFRKPIFLLNTARGEVAPLADIVQSLDSGKLLGAALDVLEKEKFSELTTEEKKLYQMLFEHKNVLLSPHVAGWTYASYKKINEVLLGKIAHHFHLD